jgi:hypothetical protein
MDHPETMVFRPELTEDGILFRFAGRLDAMIRTNPVPVWARSPDE